MAPYTAASARASARGAAAAPRRPAGGERRAAGGAPCTGVARVPLSAPAGVHRHVEVVDVVLPPHAPPTARQPAGAPQARRTGGRTCSLLSYMSNSTATESGIPP